MSAVPPVPGPMGGPNDGSSGTRAPGWLVALAGALALLVLVTGGVAVAVTVRAAELRTRVAGLEAELERSRAEIADLRDALGRQDGRPDGGGSGPLGGLLDDLLPGGLGDLFDGLGDLFGGGGQADLAGCLAASAPAPGPRVEAPDAPAQVQAIAERVAQLRRLDFVTRPDAEFLDGDEVERRITELVREDYPPEQADADRRILAMLGAVPFDIDLRAIQVELLRGQVAGYYVPETGELVVRTADPRRPLGPGDQVTLSHELQHALADQVLGLPTQDTDPTRTDEALAALALVEGDATLLMQHFALSALSPMDQLQMGMDPAVLEAQRQLDRYPSVLRAQLLFPYEEGLRFVCDLHRDGGWPAVDAAYTQLPATTAQIMFPERYRAGEQAVEPRAFGRLTGGWTAGATSTFGAAQLEWLLAAPGDDETAALDDRRGRVAAWAGGRVQLWTDGPDSAVGIALVERAGSGAATLCDTMTAWYDAAFPAQRDAAGGEALARTGDGRAGVVACHGGEVRLGIAPDIETARQLVG
jgi:hypothetical protein